MNGCSYVCILDESSYFPKLFESVPSFWEDPANVFSTTRVTKDIRIHMAFLSGQGGTSLSMVHVIRAAATGQALLRFV